MTLSANVAPSAIEARDLRCERGGRTVFSDVGFALSGGDALSVEGPNGAGKTSLLRIVAGLLRETAGSIRIRTSERDIADREERGRLCGWLGHQDGVKAQLSVRENMQFWRDLHGVGGDAIGMLDRVGLIRVAVAPAQYLSAGQRRRLALARLLVSARPIWLLDEPFAALDAAGRALVVDLVRAHCADGGVVIAATHEPLGVGETRLVLT